MKFTVLVITYNSDLKKTLYTLKSIVLQKFDSFEIVIADDASINNHFTEIKKFFQEKGFTSYKLVYNEKNAGTVKNLISGLRQSSGKYVKFIGAGDALYDSMTLQNVFDFMERNHYECCFGKLRGYQQKEDGRIKAVSFCHPFDMNAYIRFNEKRIKKNLVLYSDNVCGAAICYERNFAWEYMNKIQDNVIYEEDIFQVLSAMEGRALHLFNHYIVWYEVGSGISTSGKSKHGNLISQDVQRFYQELYQLFKNDKYVRKRCCIMGLYRIRNLYVRTVIRCFINPDAVRYLICAAWQKINKVHEVRERRTGFLDEKDFMHEFDRMDGE